MTPGYGGPQTTGGRGGGAGEAPQLTGLPVFPDDAACAGEDPRWFDADLFTHHDLALSVCAVCRVRPQCASLAVRERLSGVYGGRVFTHGRASRSKRTGAAA